MLKIGLQKAGMNMLIFALGQISQGRPVGEEYLSHFFWNIDTTVYYNL